MKFNPENFFSKICQEKFKFHKNMTRIMGTLHEDQNTFLKVYCSFLLRMRNVANKTCREYYKTHTLYTITFFLNHAIYEITWKNTAEPARPHDDMVRAHGVLDN